MKFHYRIWALLLVVSCGIGCRSEQSRADYVVDQYELRRGGHELREACIYRANVLKKIICKVSDSTPVIERMKAGKPRVPVDPLFAEFRSYGIEGGNLSVLVYASPFDTWISSDGGSTKRTIGKLRLAIVGTEQGKLMPFSNVDAVPKDALLVVEYENVDGSIGYF